ncbi:MAG: NAD(P)-dependent oxidoreductase [Spirochaetota bacterium]
MKILIADKFPEKWIDKLKEKNHEVTFNKSLTGEDLPEAIKDNNILVVRSTKVNKDTIDAAKNLKLIIRAGSGYNTIDIDYAKEKGIAVSNCPGMNSLAVAELAMTHMLALDRRLYHNVRDLRAKKWNKKEYSKADGIYGKSLGIIGIGVIGREVAKRAQAFGMRLLGYDPYLKDGEFEKLNIKKYDDIYNLAKDADIITIHLPETKETKGLFDEKFFSNMKDGATFINTSRGGVVKQDDLLKAVKEKNIKAGIDVYENEPDANANEFNDEITQYENIYGTHHIGASTNQAQDAVAEMAVKIVDEYEKTGKFLNRVNN